MKTVTVYTAAIQAAFRELRDAADFALQHKTPYAVSSICSGVANIIQGAGSYGGHPQKALMDAATSAGFTPEFYAGGIRVGYYPKEEPKPAKVTRVKKTAAAPASEDRIFEFRHNGQLLEKFRDTTEERARKRFSEAFPEWADDLAGGKVKVTNRAPAY